jgi:fructose-specific component phosphotransferase system IIB-like protein
MEERIARHRVALAKDGFTLADCQTMAKDYEVEKAAVMKMASSNPAPTPPPANTPPKVVDPKVAECRAANLKTDKEIDATYSKAKAEGKIVPAEAARFRAMEERIARHRAALARDGFTLADCQAMAKDYEVEKAAVMKMATSNPTPPPAAAAPKPVDPKLAECRAANVKTDKEIDAMYNKAKAAGKITPAEAGRFKAMEEKIARHRLALARDGFTLADCESMAKDYAAEKAAVMKIAQ